ncbi:TIGR00303 family protein [Spirulina sp. CS-785/01]|uniref:nicotinate mononucleotide-dependent phosphoribosyltransferase CobT n=1 Tax=Spirulina sp. CS-785/01 TaxID=3021716 RepID=UPI00232DDEC8|nr:TIGR00303 family protein [Spirulina sp. CS-785/01]MDB9314330.1 TIGR00303 family protein [Spirulina sp. CS-785/01]
MIELYTHSQQGQAWLARYRGQVPHLACVLGFTETGLLEGISAAGATPEDRKYTAIADAEFLVNGVQPNPRYPLPPLTVGASPTYISRTVVEALSMPVQIFNGGLPQPPAVPAITLPGQPARCLTTGQALPLDTVKELFWQGVHWGEKLAATSPYLVIAECVVGGTTTALSVLTGLGMAVQGKVNSSHPHCNHRQKWQVVQQGLRAAQLGENADPWAVVAAVGDPMQPVVAGMALAASRQGGVLLAGGTQMLAVYALMAGLARQEGMVWQPEEVVVGTTGWVAADPTGDTVGLAKLIGTVPLLAAKLDFSTARWESLRAYEAGYVKEGVGAGGCAIAAHLAQNWTAEELLSAIEQLLSFRC